jgi:transposase InsO family protein
VARASRRARRGGGGQARRETHFLGPSQGLGDDPLRRADGLRLDRAARAAPPRVDHRVRGLPARRRQLATARRAAFLTPPTGPLQVWQLDFSEFETHGGGVWRFAGCTDYWSKYEVGWHLSPTANQHDAIAAGELALTEAERLAGRSLREQLTDSATEQLRPITVVTDNGGPFRSARFARFIDDHPELTHVRIKARSPGQNGVRERAFGSLKYERLYLHDITDGHELWSHAQDYRTEFNHLRPHEALSWHRPIDVHLGQADPTEPNFETDRTLPTP